MNGVKINQYLTPKLDLCTVLKEFPGWKPANFYEDSLCEVVFVAFSAVVFATDEDTLAFILKYGDMFGAIPSSDINFDIARD